MKGMILFVFREWVGRSTLVQQLRTTSEFIWDCHALQHISVKLLPGRLRQKDCDFKVSLHSIQGNST